MSKWNLIRCSEDIIGRTVLAQVGVAGPERECKVLAQALYGGYHEFLLQDENQQKWTLRLARSDDPCFWVAGGSS